MKPIDQWVHAGFVVGGGCTVLGIILRDIELVSIGLIVGAASLVLMMCSIMDDDMRDKK